MNKYFLGLIIIATLLGCKSYFEIIEHDLNASKSVINQGYKISFIENENDLDILKYKTRILLSDNSQLTKGEKDVHGNDNSPLFRVCGN